MKAEYTIKGTIVHQETQQFLGGVTIKDTLNGNKTTTEPNGVFELKGKYKVEKNPPTEVLNSNSFYNIIPKEGGTPLGKIKFKLQGEEKKAIGNFKLSTKEDKNISIQHETFPSKTASYKNLAKEVIKQINSKIKNNHDENGNYEIELGNPAPVTGPPKAQPFQLAISLKEFNGKNINPVNLDGTIKNSVGTHDLKPQEADTSKQEGEVRKVNKEQLDLFKGGIKKGFVKILIDKALKKIASLLIPALLKLIAKFGVSQADKLISNPGSVATQGRTCPGSVEELNKLIAKKNKLTKQLNQLNKILDKINKFLSPLEKLIKGTKKALPAAKTAMTVIAFIPSTTFTPIPSGAYTKLNDALKFLEGLIELTDSKVSGGLFQLKFLTIELKKVLGLMTMLDTLIGACSEELLEKEKGDEGESGSGVETETETETKPKLLVQEKLSQALLESTQEEEKKEPFDNKVNGFILSVITVDNVEIQGVKRRRAIAKNPAGIIMLKGEPSFSSNDQILMNELKFTITQNDLKAE